MTITNVSLLLCLVVIGAAWMLRRIGNRYEPEHFCWNDCGGVLVICSVTDFERSLRSEHYTDRLFGKSKKESERLVVVRENVLFSNNTGPMSRHFSEKWSDRGCLPPNFWSARVELRLFVPFASERLATFQEQEAYFNREPVVHFTAFSQDKIFDNRAHNWKLRLAEWSRQGKVIETIIWTMAVSTCVAIFLFLSTTGACIVRDEKARNEEMVTFYTTEMGRTTVQETQATRKGMQHALVNESMVYRPDIRKGLVAQVQQLGGGLSAVCIKRRNGDLDCGLADSSLKLVVGVTAYLRHGDALAWMKGNWVESHRRRDSWYITESEAHALRNHADYRIKEENEE